MSQGHSSCATRNSPFVPSGEVASAQLWGWVPHIHTLLQSIALKPPICAFLFSEGASVSGHTGVSACV